MKIYLIIASSTIKMYFRRTQSLFWTLFFPVVMMVGLGFFGFGEYEKPKLGLIDQAENSISAEFVNKLEQKSYIEIDKNLGENYEEKLLEHKIDSVLIIPENFGSNNKIEIYYEKSNSELADSFKDTSIFLLGDFEGNNFTVEVLEKKFIHENQGYKGFLVPGIVALAIMQSGILGVVFTIINYKSQGVLKRLQAAPINPGHFLIGQLISRLLIITIQTVVLFIIGVLILDINIALGNIYAWINIGIFSILGSILFLFIGLAISGASPNEDYAAPFANLVTFPMMFLSGVFFDNDILPGSISTFTDLLPLSPLVESLRESALYGTNTFELLPELGIILAWIIIAFVIGVKTFKWE